ncbi:protein phosphatase [Parelusimicrobium proximum]
MPLNVKLAAYSDIGKIREKNEDNVFISSEIKVAVVADGMGGHNAGEIASQLAIAVFTNVITDLKKGIMKLSDKFSPELTVPERMMLLAADLANSSVYEMAQNNKDYRTMGTTMTAVMIEGDNAIAVHIGDTRLYIYREGVFTQLTTDHSLAEEQVRRGVMSKGEAEKSRVQNVLTRALGIKKNIEVDLLKFAIKEGDIMLLCSDGLNKGLTDNDIKKYLEHSPNVTLSKLCKAIVKKANDKSGKDNISAAILKIYNAPKKKSVFSEIFG